jgi:hypothetical protein
MASDLELRFLFWCGVVASIFVMKAVSFFRFRPAGTTSYFGFWFTPLCSFCSWMRAPVASRADRKSLIVRAILSLVALVVMYWGYCWTIDLTKVHGPWLAYFGIPFIVLFEANGSVIRLLCLPLGKLIPNVHRHLLASRSVGDFWRRYNVWVNEWFSENLFQLLKNRPLFASFGVFVFSGVWHELLINIPFLVLFRVNLIGTMLGYFTLQWLGIVADRRLAKRRPNLRRYFMYFVVIAPAPLIFNESLMRIFGWWP